MERDHAAWRRKALAAGDVLRRWLAARELLTLALLAIGAGGVWVFLELADAVVAGELHRIDEGLLLAMRDPADRSDPVGPRWFEEMGRDFTALGGSALLTLFTLAVAGYLWLARKHRAVAFLLVAVVGGQLLSFLLKRGFARPRPDLVPHGAFVYSASFPSGHAMASAVTYLTLAALLARVLPGRRMKLFVLTWALLLTGLAGTSRVYLGVHWPSDVVAGWAMGASWAVFCWLAAEWISRRARPRSGSEEL
jgi:undecaprenyl-diphosphatase